MRKNYISGINPKLLNYINSVGNRISDIKLALRKETEEKFPDYSMMLSDISQSELMANLIRISKSKRGLEIGVFTGYSCLSFAEALPKDGKIIALDISKEFTSLGVKYWEKAGVSDKIDLRLGPALDELDNLIKKGEMFDFAYIDADKNNYLNYYDKVLSLINKGGFIMFDNTLWSGKVTEENISEEDEDTFTLKKLNQLLRDDKRVEISMVPISDGLTIVYKI
jgi:predicted O-methyltransferase YrrM